MPQKFREATRPRGRKPVYEQSLIPILLLLGTAAVIAVVTWLLRR